MRRPLFLLFASMLAAPLACSAAGDPTPPGGGTTTTGTGGAGGGGGCDTCSASVYTPCNPDGSPGTPVTCDAVCAPGLGCVACVPGANTCIGNDVHLCGDDGQPTAPIVQTCDVAAGMVCYHGACTSACQVAADQPSNVGCEFWAVDLDQQDGFNDPASAPWGVALSNVGATPAKVTIEINTAPVGQPVQTGLVEDVTVDPGSLLALTLPTRELDCGVVPNDYASPGTCLSSNAYRITSTAPIIVYQYNVFENAYSNDASLLLPAGSLGKVYRAIGWPAGHPVAIPGFNIIDRSYVTIVGVKPNTQVTVKPSWRIKGNPPIAATAAGGEIVATIGPFDVLNLETDDATMQDDPATAADLSGTSIVATEPVAVFSGVETTSAPGGVLTVPTYPGWDSGDTCCLDHLEDQMFPVESIGASYVIARSPVRSTSGFREPDVLRFVGAAEPANVTTSLPAPWSSFTIQPGEVKTTWTQDNVVITSDKPVIVGQILISNQYVDGPYIGDPSLTVFPPIDQYRSDYIILTPSGWTQTWAVITAEVGADVSIDAASPAGCITEPAGTIGDVTFESRRCPVAPGVHVLSGSRPFGVVAYGYGSAGSYAFVGGADVKRIYDPPPIE